jgi:hypothetical protein
MPAEEVKQKIPKKSAHGQKGPSNLTRIEFCYADSYRRVTIVQLRIYSHSHGENGPENHANRIRTYILP